MTRSDRRLGTVRFSPGQQRAASREVPFLMNPRRLVRALVLAIVLAAVIHYAMRLAGAR